MSNRLSMATIHSIETLHRSGHSNRQIARILDLDRGTVNKYVKRLQGGAGRDAGGPSGEPHPADGGQNQPNPQTGSAAEIGPPGNGDFRDLAEPASGPESLCAAYRETVEQKLDAGLSMQRIFQDLQSEHDFRGSYHSVRRFVRRLGRTRPLPFRRMETEPGEEAQIDFGTGAWVVDPQGKRRRPWMFRIVLSHSRKAYSEVVWRQTSDNFIAAIENAFHHFGGVPKRLVIDNLKAAVKRADWYDPEVHPKLQSFAVHYGTAFVPTKPYTPEHKGKVESAVKYAKNNGLKGRTFGSLAEQNAHLLHWEETVADTRIHGTTKKQVRKQFKTAERLALLPLPRDRFALFQEARRTVSRDGHVEVDKAFYSAPPEYITRRVWVRWDARVVRVFNDRWEQIALHAKCEPGRFRTDGAHIPEAKVSAVERGTDALLRRVACIGPHTKAWSESVIQSRGVEGVRVLVGLKALAGKHRSAELERACETALAYGALRLRSIRNLLKCPVEKQQQTFSFIEEHPIIRPLSDYSVESLNDFRKERHS
jgi:transposase